MDAVKIIRDARWRLEVGDITREQYEELIAPLRDVEVVVRCKDCEHWQDYNGDHFVLQNCSRNSHVMKHGNDYCSWAERKDGDHHEG